ncbi:hypothetical protein ABMA57_02080 [Saccharospirillum sp. HFRX-1]|uniref:hypothetical protein n=1 Tax=unclassified Saccharospirillum TaxID=2633430 RepID=UPI0037222254
MSFDINKPFDSATSLFQIVGASISIFYVIGYIGVNSYFSRYGFYSYEFISVQFLSAGVIFSIIIAAYYFFVGRRIFEVKKYYGELLKIEKKSEPTKWWKLYIGFFIIYELQFQSSIAVHLLYSILFGASNILHLFTAILIGAFIIDYLVTYKLENREKHSENIIYVKTLLYTIVIFLVYNFLPDKKILQLHMFFLYFSLLIFFLSHFNFQVKDFFSAFLVVVMLGFATIELGSRFYGEIRFEVGGGEPRLVNLIFNESSLITKDGSDLYNMVQSKVYLIGETSSELFLDLGSGDLSKPLRISKDLIAGVQPILINGSDN